MERQIAVTDSPKWREKHQTRTMKLCFGFVLLLVAAPAPARDNGQWTSSPANVRQWFQQLMQPDNPRVSCCGEADAFEADRGRRRSLRRHHHRRERRDRQRHEDSRPQQKNEMG